jgi:hypothetical protein
MTTVELLLRTQAALVLQPGGTVRTNDDLLDSFFGLLAGVHAQPASDAGAGNREYPDHHRNAVSPAREGRAAALSGDGQATSARPVGPQRLAAARPVNALSPKAPAPAG